jgi:hypothetical protein
VNHRLCPAILLAALCLSACDQPAAKKAAAPANPGSSLLGPRSASAAPVSGARPENLAKNSAPAAKAKDAVPAPDTRATSGAMPTPPEVTKVDEPAPAAPADAPEGGVLKHTETDSGLIIDDLKFGDGVEAKPHQTVVIHCRGTLPDGKEFYSSYTSGKPATFEMDRLIPGWREGLPGMKVGGKRRLIVPPDLGYGKQEIKGPNGQVLIPPNSMLIFEVELVGVQ